MSKLKTEEGKKPWKIKIAICRIILEIRGCRQLLSNYIKIRISNDGRIRSIYKAHSVETARWACEGYIDGSGNNAQTWPREALEIPDEILDPNVDWEKSPLFDLENTLDDSDRQEANEVEDKEYATS